MNKLESLLRQAFNASTTEAYRGRLYHLGAWVYKLWMNGQLPHDATYVRSFKEVKREQEVNPNA